MALDLGGSRARNADSRGNVYYVYDFADGSLCQTTSRTRLPPSSCLDRSVRVHLCGCSSGVLVQMM